MTKMLFLLFRLLSVSLLSPRVFSLFLIQLGGAPKIDLPLSMFSLANSCLTSLFSVSTLLAEETKTVVLVETILGEGKYSKAQTKKSAFLSSLWSSWTYSI